MLILVDNEKMRLLGALHGRDVISTNLLTTWVFDIYSVVVVLDYVACACKILRTEWLFDFLQT